MSYIYEWIYCYTFDDVQNPLSITAKLCSRCIKPDGCHYIKDCREGSYKQNIQKGGDTYKRATFGTHINGPYDVYATHKRAIYWGTQHIERAMYRGRIIKTMCTQHIKRAIHWVTHHINDVEAT